ncbi:hypothetical protein [Brevibacillus laterosporus]|uniref:Phage tail protein n=1 Tax=Brevibacillus laterosporus TaxID=1465 RepID=A0AAP3DJH3_BRELA|nr:hypothetical protein [Brevibacillus laterosporus]MCR8981657.1 hypothetical protein [Brevibacillus laterosporus]MCZ0808812.1 hypothetical protein [Brevibacillus laterosporus]MCZ0827215.1 hypothetical protein [Brevibacillus laterosporus]MCZ0850971.1 hypothetical protein [Brevibacillus laterosporus]
MAIYPVMTITQRGKELYAKSQTGTAITYTRMRIGSGSYAGDPSILTDLVQPIDYVSINSFSRTGSTAHIKAVFQNNNITQTTYSCEIGIFANDPDLGEIMYAYTNAGTKGDHIPPISTGPFSREFQLNVAVGTASQVVANIPDTLFVPLAGGTMTGPLILSGNPTQALQASPKQYVDEKVAETSSDFETHSKNFSNPHKVTASQVGAETPAEAQAKANAAENNAKNASVPRTGGTMTGPLIAQNNTSYGAKQVRNIILSTNDPTGGDNGDIWIKYKA